MYQKPNVLFVFADQLSMAALRIYGNSNHVDTPNIDRLAEKGVRFERSYCTTPQCSPSRSSILTGLYPHKTGVIGNMGTEGSKALDPVLPTLGSCLQQSGYRTGYFGKWHLGSAVSSFGFEDVKEYGRGNDSKVTDEVLRFLAEKDKRPWFSMVSYDNPHDIYLIEEEIEAGREIKTSQIDLPVNFSDDLSTKPRAQRQFRDEDQGEPLRHYSEEEWKHYIAFYYQLIERIDAEVGKIINKLIELDQLEQTIIIFTSDHGDLMGAHRSPYKGPMMYDELIKVPFIIRYPRLLPLNESREQLMINADLLPTICDLIGIEIPTDLDGISLKEILLDSQAKGREEVLLQYYSKQKWVNPIRTLVTHDYKYNLYLSGEEELYVIAGTDGEARNLAEERDYQQVKESLKERLITYIKKEEDPFFSYALTNRAGEMIK